MKEQIHNFLEYLKIEKNYSSYTILNYEEDLKLYDSFLKQEIIDYKTINYQEITNFFVFLDERKLSKRSISRVLSTIRTFYKYLTRNNIIKNNPFSLISSPKVDKILPKFLYYNELEELFKTPDLNTPLGIRNRLILELLYATGIRVSELVNIKLEDTDLNNKRIKILGKGNKERIVFFEGVCCKYLTQYIKDVRPTLVKSSQNYLLLNNNGAKLTERGVRYILDNIIKESSLHTKISPHMIRHTFATHLLNEGCDILSVQELLGHESLKATQIYTHLTNEKIKEVYFKAHPRSNKKIDMEEK